MADADDEVESQRQETGSEIAEASSDERAGHRVEPRTMNKSNFTFFTPNCSLSIRIAGFAIVISA